MLTRRTLLKWLGISPAAPVALRGLRRQVRRYELLTVSVASFQYHEGMDASVAAGLEEGSALALLRDPQNPHDERALAIHTPAGRKLGYVPRRHNRVPSRLADQGVTLRAELAAFDPQALPWERAEVRVWQEV